MKFWIKVTIFVFILVFILIPGVKIGIETRIFKFEYSSDRMYYRVKLVAKCIKSLFN